MKINDGKKREGKQEKNKFMLEKQSKLKYR